MLSFLIPAEQGVHAGRRCIYCSKPIGPMEDSQRIARNQYAHSACAWAVEDTFWAEADFPENKEN